MNGAPEAGGYLTYTTLKSVKADLRLTLISHFHTSIVVGVSGHTVVASRSRWVSRDLALGHRSAGAAMLRLWCRSTRGGRPGHGPPQSKAVNQPELLGIFRSDGTRNIPRFSNPM
jgi:hypothetical protein